MKTPVNIGKQKPRINSEEIVESIPTALMKDRVNSKIPEGCAGTAPCDWAIIKVNDDLYSFKHSGLNISFQATMAEFNQALRG